MVLRLSCLASVAFAALSLSAPASAQQTETSPNPTPPNPAPADAATSSQTVQTTTAAQPVAQDNEVILKADQFEENRDTSVITASGNVEIRVGARTLKADKVIYDRATETALIAKVKAAAKRKKKPGPKKQRDGK